MENDASPFPARRRRGRPPEPPVAKVRNRYRMAPRSRVFTNRSLSRWGKRRTENRARETPRFFERSRCSPAENAACSVFSWGSPETRTKSRMISSARSSERSRDAKASKALSPASTHACSAGGGGGRPARAEEANEVRRTRRGARGRAVRRHHDRPAADRAPHGSTTTARQPQLGLEVVERERSGAARWRRLAFDVQ